MNGYFFLTLHLPGNEQRYFKIKTACLTLEKFEEMIIITGKGRVPNFAIPQKLTVQSFDDNKKEVLNDFELPRDKEKFEMFKFEPNTKYSISFTTWVHVLRLPESGLFNTTDKIVSLAYRSDVNTEGWLEILSERLNYFDFCVDDIINMKSRPFMDDFFKSTVERDKTYYVGKKQCPYSEANMAQLFRKVELHLGPCFVKKNQTTHNPTFYMDNFLGKRSRKPMSAAMAAAKADLNSAVWTNLVDECVRELSLLSSCVNAEDCSSEAEQRLLINEIVKRIALYSHATFSIGKQQNDAFNIDTDCLGWGPIDFLLRIQVMYEDSVVTQEAILIHSCIDQSEDDDNADPEDDDPDGYDENPGKIRKIASVGQQQNAPARLSDNLLAKLGCQAYDLMVLNGLCSVGMVLCTGHKWLYHVLLRRDSEKGRYTPQK